jgi:hypothetical protein
MDLDLQLRLHRRGHCRVVESHSKRLCDDIGSSHAASMTFYWIEYNKTLQYINESNEVYKFEVSSVHYIS